MNEKELIDQTIQEYVNLQRIKAAHDQKAEIEYQERVLKARLQSLGVHTEQLDLDKQ